MIACIACYKNTQPNSKSRPAYAIIDGWQKSYTTSSDASVRIRKSPTMELLISQLQAK